MEHRSGSPTTIAFFNNKGGVGKTTLACNFAAYVAKVLNKTVTVVDLDPQSNSTQLLLDENTWTALYEDHDQSERRTILQCFREIRRGNSTVDRDIHLMDSPRFGVKVLAGHPTLSSVEDILSESWGEFQAGKVGGALRTFWLGTLRSSLESEVVIIDLGPSLGALNRSALIGSTRFITPVAADLFSLYALENIGSWMTAWIDEYGLAMERTSVKNAEFRNSPDLPSDLPIASGYAGYTVQQYVTKMTGGELRRTQAYDRYKDQIPRKAQELSGLRAPDAETFDLGIVPNMFSMIPLAQSVHAPIMGLQPGDGVRGAQVYQQARYTADLRGIFERMAENAGLQTARVAAE